MDVHSPQQRSYNMSRIKGKNTKPEEILRKLLWKHGYRYRLHYKKLPGKPDIVSGINMTVNILSGLRLTRISGKKRLQVMLPEIIKIIMRFQILDGGLLSFGNAN